VEWFKKSFKHKKIVHETNIVREVAVMFGFSWLAENVMSEPRQSN
jgi:hypothetical protein